MDDLISRQMAIDALNHMCSEDGDGITVNRTKVHNMLGALPTIQSERKIGQWIPSDSELEIKCNKCGKDFSEYVDSIDYIYLAEYPKFCPNCGVKMEGGEQK